MNGRYGLGAPAGDAQVMPRRKGLGNDHAGKVVGLSKCKTGEQEAAPIVAYVQDGAGLAVSNGSTPPLFFPSPTFPFQLFEPGLLLGYLDLDLINNRSEFFDLYLPP